MKIACTSKEFLVISQICKINQQQDYGCLRCILYSICAGKDGYCDGFYDICILTDANKKERKE